MILNQSVGNGGFAANPSGGTVYTTEVDYVRVYQKPGMTNMGGKIVGESDGVDRVEMSGDTGRSSVYDLQGRRVMRPTRGLYIVNGRKMVVK